MYTKRTLNDKETESIALHNMYRLPYMLLTVVWLLFIYQLSSQPVFGEASVGWVISVLYLTAYSFIYGMLSLLILFSLFRVGQRLVWKSWGVILFVFLAALSDEWNQSLSGFHRGSLKDVAVDLIGAMISLLIYNASFKAAEA